MVFLVVSLLVLALRTLRIHSIWNNGMNEPVSSPSRHKTVYTHPSTQRYFKRMSAHHMSKAVWSMQVQTYLNLKALTMHNYWDPLLWWNKPNVIFFTASHTVHLATHKFCHMWMALVILHHPKEMVYRFTTKHDQFICESLGSWIVTQANLGGYGRLHP
jgi:hypothetical protein